MKIAFDLRRIGNPGIGRYMKCLAESITAQAPEHEYLLILPPESEHLIHAPNAQKLYTNLKYYSFREQFELPRILSRHKVDLLHAPHFLLPLVRPCPAVATIHDVIYMACPEDLPSLAGLLYYRAMMHACSRMATRIITDSEHSKAEIIRYLHTDPSKIEVVYPAVDPFFQAEIDPAEVASVRSRFGIDRDYFLCVGIYKPRKNQLALLKAFQLLLKGGMQSQLVIAGPMGEGEPILRELAQELGIAQHVRFTGFINDSELRALYSAARVDVCPSLYEGFGFTVLEAMACGTPVVCSSATSLPEVAGKAALYFDPHKPEEMATQLLRAFSDDSVRASLILDGRRNLLRFNWAETARQTLAVYYQALQLPLQSGLRMKASGNHDAVKVAFDASALKPQYNHHGIQVYTRNLLAALQRRAGLSGIEIRPFLSAAEDATTGKFTAEPGFSPRNSALMRSDRLWRYGGATAAAFLDGADILLNPHGVSLPIKTLLPTVTTIHDLTPMVMPCFSMRTTFFLKFLLTRSAKSSTAIIAVSENTRQDLIRICGVPESKIHVIYEGYDRDLFNRIPPDAGLLQQLLGRLGINRPYILHHGAIQPRKNLPRLIAAYRQMLARNSQLDLDLVLAGPLAWQHQETVNAARDDRAGKGKVILTGALNDRELSLLVRGASLEVVPSLYEGFCLPMVEAMACGVPTIVANCSCLPEISGGVLRYFDPRSVEDISACMETVLLSRDLQAELAEHGRGRAQKFSWDICAQETLGVLGQVAHKHEVRSRAAGVAL